MSSTTKTLLLIALFALYYLVPIEYRALWQPDETRYAEISREMLASGNWVTPHFFDLRYFEKPVAGYWVNSIGQWLFGDGNIAVRAGAIGSTLLTAALVYWLGRRLFLRHEMALTASLIFLTLLLVYGVGSFAVLDPILALWLVATMCSYWLAAEAHTASRRLMGYLLLGVACAMGFMTKGFLALAIPVLAILPWAIWQKRFKELLLFGPLTIIVAVLVSLPWSLAIHHQQPDFWHYFFWVEHIQRFAESDAQHKAPFWYYVPVLVLGSLPWLGLLPGALLSGWRGRQQQPGLLYLLSWVVMPFLFFSIAKGKLPTYILSCFAPLALLLAHYGSTIAPLTGKAFRANGWINAAFGALATLALLLILAPWGLSHRPVFTADETLKVVLGCMAFISWGTLGWLAIDRARWRWAALCPLVMALVFGAAIPDSVRDSKQPQEFVASVSPQLNGSRYILVNNPGVAAQVAWSLKRSDVVLFEQKGEVNFGLSYPDAQDKFVSFENFPAWLAAHRRLGNVSLVLLLSSKRDVDPTLPVADDIYRQGRLVLLSYHQRP